jgi:hypothetical protein
MFVEMAFKKSHTLSMHDALPKTREQNGTGFSDWPLLSCKNGGKKLLIWQPSASQKKTLGNPYPRYVSALSWKGA